MTKEYKKLKRQIANLKSIVSDAYEKVHENNGFYVVDVSELVDEMATELELDETFDATEIKDLKKAKFTLSKDNKTATKKYWNVPVTVTKCEFSEYNLKFGTGKNELEDGTPDFYDVTDSTSGFFTELFNQFKEEWDCK